MPKQYAQIRSHPHWSLKTNVRLNGKAVAEVKAGRYLKIHRKWKAGDRIDVTLDMSFHLWSGEQECEGKTSPLVRLATPFTAPGNQGREWQRLTAAPSLSDG